MTTPPAGLDEISLAPAPPRRFGLYSAATVIDDAKLKLNRDYWWSTDTCATGGLWPAPCIDPTVPVPDRKLTPGIDHNFGRPFIAYAGIECDRVGFTDAGPRAAARLAASEQTLVERALWTGDAGAYPHLGEGAEDITSWATIGKDKPLGEQLAAALGLLEYAGAAASSGQLVIHAPRILIPILAENMLTVREGNRLTTPAGSVWAFGGGYTAPSQGHDLALYATGPVTVRRGPIVPLEPPGGIDFRTNLAMAIHERAFQVAFDCPHFKVTLTNPYPIVPGPAPTGLKVVPHPGNEQHQLDASWDPVPGADYYTVTITPTKKEGPGDG
ncbi:hypothetical protein [Streptomyces sp. NBC_01304]|uniref:hypothetical protein n=1 Tax=Streptomyces sp. NBC_01304 TaxID=2903818 RepID=UPI002E16732F|nr:hypothetical protein OG430_44775 [Streptomyces sp. NBC_01304]